MSLDPGPSAPSGADGAGSRRPPGRDGRATIRQTARAVLRAEVDHGLAELVGDPGRPRGWTLLIDGTAQSYVDLDDPLHLEFEYVRRLAHVVDLLGADPEAVPGPGPVSHRPVRALHLGGGAWTLARYTAVIRPGSEQRVVDIDGALTEFVGRHLPADDAGIEITVSDARAAVVAAPPAAADLVVLDVFAGARVPAHLTTGEFTAAVARVLAPGGVYAVNLGDGGALEFSRGQVGALAATFDQVALIAQPDVLKGRRFGNVVLLGSDAALPIPALTRRTAGDPFPARLLDDRSTRAMALPPPSDARAAPSPLPPPGFFGRPPAD